MLIYKLLVSLLFPGLKTTYAHAKQDGCRQMIIKMVPLSGEKFHFALLSTVLSAPMSFFVNTDSGVTLNRFSQDLQLIDMELPIAALNTFASTQPSFVSMATFTARL